MRHPLLLLLCFSLSLTAQDGITFTDESFNDLLAEAKQEDKLIFIDAYTTWCGPCKMMSAKVFPDARVGEVYNDRFINAKIDMEKGEGPKLARRYGVQAYPTYLFVNGDGDLVHKGLGYIPIEPFLQLADEATGPNSMGAMGERYRAGERDPAFIRDYAKILTSTYQRETAEKVVDQYLDDQPDWFTEDNLRLIVGAPGQVGDKRMVFLIEHADTVGQVVGTGTLMTTLQQALIGKWMRDNRRRQLPKAEALTKHYAKWAAPLQDRLKAHYTLLQSQQAGDYEAYVPAALAYYEAYPSNDFAELNGAAWNVYENSDDPAALKTALGWAKESVRLNSYYPNLDTLAWLYSKLGDDKMARETAERAIEAAKASGSDFSETEALLER